MRSWCWTDAGNAPCRAAALWAVALAVLSAGGAANAAEANAAQRIVVAQGRAYRLAVFTGSDAVDLQLRGADGTWIPFTRTRGERAWYGYNRKSAGEVRSSARPPKIAHLTRGGVGIVAVSCQLEPGVTHHAEYVALPDFCVVVSEIEAARPPAAASLIRLAPRFDMDIRRLLCYAFRDARDILHTGTISSLGARPKYIGVGGWGDGCKVSALSASRAYLAFFNPVSGPLVAFIFPRHRALWRGARHFLQLWAGGANYLYAGVFDSGHFNSPAGFVIYARGDGSLERFEADLPAVLARFDELVRAGAVKLPAASAALEARQLLRSALRRRAPETVASRAQWLAGWRQLWAVSAARRALDLGRPVVARDILAAAPR